MTHFTAPKLIALTATLISLAGVATATPLPEGGALHLKAGSAAASDTTVIARRGRGADDPPGHAALEWQLKLPSDIDRRGRGKDDPVGHG